jgi:glucose/arabinose dehydrogenase
MGGDEVNIFNLNNIESLKEVNFGWPIASYGQHYDRSFKPEAPLYKSHEKYGFTEPAIYFVPSIATSSVTPVDFKINEKSVLAVGALAGASIHFVERTAENRLESVSILELQSRVRTVSKGPNDCILVSLDTGEAGLICKVD